MYRELLIGTKGTAEIEITSLQASHRELLFLKFQFKGKIAEFYFINAVRQSRSIVN